MRGRARAGASDATGMEFARDAHMYDGEIELRNANVE